MSALARLTALACSLLLTMQAAIAQTLLQVPATMDDFPSRWEWALSGAQNDGDSRHWAAYEFSTTLDERIDVQRLWGNNNYFAWNNRQPGYGSGWRNGLSMRTLLDGNEQMHPAPTRLRSLVFLVRFDGQELREVRVLAPEDVVDWRHLPVYWAGTADSDESYQAMATLLQPGLSTPQRRMLIRAVGLHDNNDRTGFLFSLFTAEAWQNDHSFLLESLAIQSSGEVESILIAVASDENRAMTERRVAVSALSRYPTAQDLLMQLAGPLNPQSLRAESLESLSLFPGAEVEELLLAVLDSEAAVDVLEEAVASLASRPGQFGQLETIVRQHPIEDVREEALRHLVLTDPRQAFSAMAWAARNDSSMDNRREAIERMRNAPAEVSVPLLLELAENPAEPERIRREAVETLGHFNGEQVRSGLNRLAWSDESARVRAEAVDSLGRLNETPAQILLLELARQHPNAHTRAEAMERLQQELF